MRYVITKERNDIPAGFRNLTDEEIAKDFLNIDADKSYFISKNEWMANFLKMLVSDLPALEKDGPDSIMGKIQELSDEFDKYDLDGNKHIDYLEYKNFIADNIWVCED